MFNLKRHPANWEQDLERVALACGDLDAAALKAQWQDVRARALLHLNDARGSLLECAAERNANRAAWTNAIRALESHHATARSHPTGTLKKAVAHYLAFGASTSGVEQAFSKAAWLAHQRRAKANPETEESLLKLGLDLANHDPTELVKMARRVWICCFGAARARSSERTRVDKGIKRLRGEADDGRGLSEAGFIAKRRKAASQAGLEFAESVAASANDNPMPDLGDAWTEAHEKERAFFLKKRQALLVQACHEETLLPSEQSAELRESAQICQAKLVHNERLRQKKRRRDSAVLRGLSPAAMKQSLRGKKMFLAAPATEALQASLRSMFCQTTPSLMAAEAVVCPAPGSVADPRHSLLAGLRGLYEVSAAFLTDNKGAAIKYKPAGLMARAIVVSATCAQRQPKFWSFLRSALPAEHSWALHMVPQDQLRSTQGRYQAGVAWIVVAEDERDTQARQSVNNAMQVAAVNLLVLRQALRNAKNVYTIRSLCEQVRKVDVLASCNGF